jgi:PAS domain S-box-containing protein
MQSKNRNRAGLGATIRESMVLTGIGLAATYWVLESLLYFFATPNVNFIQQLFGSDIFEIWTRVLVLALFLIFGSHVQYTINKRRESDEARLASEEKYRTLVENIEEGFFECNVEGRFEFFNDSLCRISGYDREELLQMNFLDFTSAETTERMFATFNQIYQTGSPAAVNDYEIVTKRGETKTIEMSASPILDQKHQPVGFRGVVRDVSDRLEAEKERKRLEKQLQQAQKMEAIGNLAGGIAHDFNNILMGMLGNTSLILSNTDRSAPHYEKLKNIERYVQSGASLTKQLLGFARGGKYEVKPINLNEIVRKSVKMFGRTRKEIDIHMEHLAEDLWTVEADQGQIEQVLLNLYINSWHAMPQGGQLYLQTENLVLDDSYTKPYIVEPGRYVKMSVSDTGMGMDRATQERIFEPFFTTKEMGRGTGLGLATVYGIVKNHGGFINVYSEVGQGTTFNIYLPASSRTITAEQEPDQVLVQGSETVLFIDDEEMILEIAQDMLEQLGYRALLANGGEEGIAVYRKQRGTIDLVILDMVMPGMGGGETFDALQKVNPEVKVLLASGYSLNGEASRILYRGCKGFIQKPFDMQQLSDKVREVLDQ